MSDRALQDELIRALADAGYRRSPEWRERALADDGAVERFARFLARNFYRNRVIHFFKYSRSLARVIGRLPEAAIDGEGFDAILPRAVLGSRDTAREVAALVAADQRTAPGAGRVPYLDDLLRYQESMMVAEAGPRDWAGAENPGRAPTDAAAQVVEGSTVVRLDHDLPAILPTLLQRPGNVPEAQPGPVRLLVARSPHGRVSVVVLTDAMERALAGADGSRTLGELASEAGADAVVRDLVDIGAIRAARGS